MVSARLHLLGVVAAALVCATSATARADDDRNSTSDSSPRSGGEQPRPDDSASAASRGIPEPRVHHAPVSSARAHDDLRIGVTLDHAELVRRAIVVYRTARGDLKVLELLRADIADGTHLAVIPAADVQAPGLAYAVEIERTDGRRVAGFASRSDLQPVLVIDDHMDVRERAALRRLGSRRSVVAASTEVVSFGTTCGALPQGVPSSSARSAGCDAGQTPVSDYFWRVEAGYTYRPLRTVAEFGIKIGVVRGYSPVGTNATSTSVGLNYAEPWLRFRLADAWHLELAVLTSVTEVGFSVGGGVALLIGDPYGTHLTLGAEEIGFGSTYFGSRIYTRLDLLVKEGITVGPAVELTDMPHADSFGVRLYGDARIQLPRGFSVGARAGYQARRSTSGGVGLGTTLAYSF